MKSKVKPLLPNSVLNLETNSDSLSNRSKGVRLSSAKQVKYHKIKIKILKILLKLKLKLKLIKIKIKNIKIISYEHNCEILRITLIEVKVEFELHLDHKIGYRDSKLKIIKTK